MPSRKPTSLVAAALAAPPLSWPELYELFGQQAAALPAVAWIVGTSINWVFFEFQLDQYGFEAAGTCMGSYAPGFQAFIPALGPAPARRDWEHALRRQFLRAAAGDYPAWNHLKLVYELVPAAGQQRTAVLHEAERTWDEALATLNQQQQAARQLPPAARTPATQAARQAWVASQRARLEGALVQALLAANSRPQQLLLTDAAGSCSAQITIRNGEILPRVELLPPAMAWLAWRYWRLRREIEPHWQLLQVTLGLDGQWSFQFFNNARLSHTRSGFLRADGQLEAIPPPPGAQPPGPALQGNLQALGTALAQALDETRPDASYAALLSWPIKPGRPAEIACSDDTERNYLAEDAVLPHKLRAQLTRFAEASAAAQAPWTWLYVLVPPAGGQPEVGYFTAEQLPTPYQAADILPYYAHIREGLVPQLPPTWETLTVAAGFGDGLIPYQASARLASGELLAVQVQASGRAMVALGFLYTYGLHAAGCDWQHVELAFQRSGQLQAAFYYADYDTARGIAAEPATTAKNWLPAVA